MYGEYGTLLTWSVILYHAAFSGQQFLLTALRPLLKCVSGLQQSGLNIVIVEGGLAEHTTNVTITLALFGL